MSGVTCECPISSGGWCERHRCQKSAQMVVWCRQGGKWWEAWESGKGPGQQGPQQPGLGDLVESGLSAVGITKERYVAAKAALGLKRRCGCLERKRKLNSLGKKLGIG